ncbi:pilus (MSHA type) biogenesis protein MshL [Sulfurospirillum sp. 1307]|jgi:general secretion pathway protein D
MKLGIISLILTIFTINLSANCENKFFSFSIKEANNQSVTIMDVLENISDECKMSIVFEDSVVKDALNKKLNYINVKDFSLKDLLDLLLVDNNIFYKLTNSNQILKVATFKTKTYFIDYVSFSQRSSKTNKVIKTGSSSGNANNGSDSTTMDFTSEFKFWEKITGEISDILDRDEDNRKIKSKVLINQEAGMLTVTGTKKQLDRVDSYIDSLMNRLHKEILLEAKIIEVKYSNSKTDGIDWSQFQLNINGSSDATRSRTDGVLTRGFRQPNYLVGYDFSMAGMIKFLKTQGDVKIVSNPKIMTLNNQPAVINVGQEINYRYQTQSTTDLSSNSGNTAISYENDSTFVGVTLDITPQVTKDGFIILKINPIVSEIGDTHLDKNDIPILAPDIRIKQLSSIVRVKDGEKVIVGGLISKDEDVADTSVPGLSAIPILGKAFQSSTNTSSKSELIIIITPHIVNGKHNPSLDSLDEDKHIIKAYK